MPPHPDRPRQLAASVDDPALRAALLACPVTAVEPDPFIIGHRGAPLGYAEHTVESYRAAAAQGAGVIECDVTFTADAALVCRHGPCDLATTTNILETPLAERCREPFRPAQRAADGTVSQPAGAKCCASDLTLAQFRSLRGRQELTDPGAASVAAFLAPSAAHGRLLTHAESIALIDALGVDFAPELKAPDASVGFAGSGYDDDTYAARLIREYKSAGIEPARVQAQSFRRRDIAYWLQSHPAFGQRAVWLDGRYESGNFDPADPSTWTPSMRELRAAGIETLAPPLWVLLALDGERIVPSAYARAARAHGFDLVAWTLERSGSLESGGGWYFQTVAPAIDADGDIYRVLKVLRDDIGVRAVFTDWPATVAFFQACVPDRLGASE